MVHGPWVSTATPYMITLPPARRSGTIEIVQGSPMGKTSTPKPYVRPGVLKEAIRNELNR